MINIINYLQFAKDNEKSFREILKDMELNKEKRSAGIYIPRDLEIDLPIDDFFKKYSTGNRIGIFTITDFSSPENGIMKISFQDIAPLSGGGASLFYKINEDNTLTYIPDKGFIIMS